jgi:hypothetical protein
MSDIILPRQDKDGNYYVSYSQLSSFNAVSGFNTKLPGKLEYIQSYFFGERWPDAGWAEFGSDAENYVCYRDRPDLVVELDKELKAKGERTITESIESFSLPERKVLDTIEPLGTFQKELRIWLFPNVYVLGYIDDATEDFMYLRDYKTGSAARKADYSGKNYKQLDIYSIWVMQEYKVLPKKLEVVLIERKGNCMNMVNARNVLTVGSNVWYIERPVIEENLYVLKDWMKKQVLEIAEYYKIFKKVYGN